MNNIKLFIGTEEIELKIFKFPGGEMNVQILGDTRNPWNECRIVAKVINSDNLMSLLLLTDACKRFWGGDTKIELVLPYLPYMQQDRVCNNGEALSSKVLCDLINLQGYNSVTVYDPHSDVAPALLNNCIIVEQHILLKGIENHIDISNTQLAIPDAGAMKKGHKVAKHLGIADIIECGKNRAVQTGRITDTKVYSEVDPNKDILVVDDICAGGATFVALAEKLRTLTKGDLYLYTTHGIYSKGLAPLLKHYKHLFTANSFCDNVNEDFLTILKYKGDKQ